MTLSIEKISKYVNATAARSIVTPVRRVNKPSIVWVNKNYYLSIGLLTRNEQEEYSRTILDKCAVLVSDGSSSSDCLFGLADRYGGDGIVNNGGSGRALIIDGFSVKGVGKTYLASKYTDNFHSHGSATLEEGIREVIYSKIVNDEHPHGAVPIIALIDIGEFHVWNTASGPMYEHRVLIVRPAFIRPAYFERATFFLTENPNEGEQDTQRVRNSFQQHGAQQLLDDNYNFISKWAEQIAFGFINRLSHGAYVSSNVSMDGSLADFGATSCVPSWAKIELASGHPAFGFERQSVDRYISSIVYYHWRFSDAYVDANALKNDLSIAFEKSYGSAIVSNFLINCGVSKIIADELKSNMELLYEILEIKRRFSDESFNMFNGAPLSLKNSWDLDQVWTSDKFKHLRSLLNKNSVGQGGDKIKYNEYVMKSRPGLYKSNLKNNIHKIINYTFKYPMKNQHIHSFINKTYAMGRRCGYPAHQIYRPCGYFISDCIGFFIYCDDLHLYAYLDIKLINVDFLISANDVIDFPEEYVDSYILIDSYSEKHIYIIKNNIGRKYDGVFFKV